MGSIQLNLNQERVIVGTNTLNLTTCHIKRALKYGLKKLDEFNSGLGVVFERQYQTNMLNNI